MLFRSPSAKREPLTWNPTGWHNKKTAHGWLYNRSHLIGYQLTGENNNPKNLMTGTQTLNSPLMLAHEMDIAYYLKQSNDHYVRYEVKPIFRGNELVARGVQMRAQSIGDNTIHFNVYILMSNQDTPSITPTEQAPKIKYFCPEKKVVDQLSAQRLFCARTGTDLVKSLIKFTQSCDPFRLK